MMSANKVRFGFCSPTGRRELLQFLFAFTLLAAIYLLLGAFGAVAGGVLMSGAAITTANPADFANRQQTYFNPKLLKALQYGLKLCQYGLSQGYTTIGDTVRFFRPRKATTAYINAQALTGLTITPLLTPTALTEGVKPTNLTEVGVGYVDIKMTQRAGLAQISDRTTALDLLNTLETYTKTMGEDAALDYDTVVRNWLVNGVYNSNATYATGDDGGYFERFAGVENTGNSANDFATLTGLSKPNGKITRGVALGVVTQLKTSKVPTIGGKYVAIVAPQVVHDIRQDELWLRAATFQDSQNLYKDLEVMLDGVAYVNANNPFIEDNIYGTEDATDDDNSGLIYSTLYLGADAFGIPNLTNKDAGGTQAAPRLIVVNGPDKADPLNQLRFVGWKSFFGAAPFVTSVSQERPRFVSLRSKSTFV